MYLFQVQWGMQKSLTTCFEGSAFPFLVANGVVQEKQLSELIEPLCTAGIASLSARLPHDSVRPQDLLI
jgi:hypothetical protein